MPQPRHGQGGGGHGGGGGGQRHRGRFDVGSTENKPELKKTIPIGTVAGKGRKVVLSLGADSDTDSPLPDLAADDRLLAFAELELTTDADDPHNPGRIGNAYTYAPDVEATMLLADDPGATEAKRGRAIELVRKPWKGTISHQRHHEVVTFGDGELSIPAGGLPWRGPAYLNVVVSASHRKAKPGDVLLVGQNETTPVVVQDMAGIRVVRFRPASSHGPDATIENACLCGEIAITKQHTVVLAHELPALAKGERLLVKGHLVTDATGLPAPARISTRMFVADRPDQVEPGGAADDLRDLEGPALQVHRLQLHPGRRPADHAQVRRRQGRRGAGRRPLREPRRGQRGAVRRHARDGSAADRHRTQPAGGDAFPGAQLGRREGRKARPPRASRKASRRWPAGQARGSRAREPGSGSRPARGPRRGSRARDGRRCRTAPG